MTRFVWKTAEAGAGWDYYFFAGFGFSLENIVPKWKQRYWADVRAFHPPFRLAGCGLLWNLFPDTPRLTGTLYNTLLSQQYASTGMDVYAVFAWYSMYRESLIENKKGSVIITLLLTTGGCFVSIKIRFKVLWNALEIVQFSTSVSDHGLLTLLIWTDDSN